MTYTLDLSYYQDLIRPVICRLQDCYGNDGLIEERSQLILWQVALHYPGLLTNEAGLLGYVQEALLSEMVL